VALLHIIEGVRPEKPVFNTTRGYTEELWVMTTSCWDEDPTKRPTVDTVLDTLRRAAERWEPRAEEDDSSESDSPTTPERADEPDAIPPSTLPSRESATHLVPTPTPSTLAPLTPKNGTLPISISDTSSKEKEIRFVIARPLEEPRSAPVISTKEKTKRTPVSAAEDEQVPALDEAVDRVLAGASSPLGADEVRKVVETLEKVSRKHPLPTNLSIQPAVDRCWSPNTQ